MNSWGYNSVGQYVCGSLSYNVAFQMYSFAGMLPAGAYTALALSGRYIQATATMSIIEEKEDYIK